MLLPLKKLGLLDISDLLLSPQPPPPHYGFPGKLHLLWKRRHPLSEKLRAIKSHP